MAVSDGDRDLIVIDRVVKQYGSATALAGISLRIRRGEFLSLLGPSGCGKTTLLRTIAGFVEPTSGEISIDGQPMNAVPPHRRPVNMVFQNYALFPHLTITENVAFGPRRRGVAKAEVAEQVAQVLNMVGMDGFGDCYPRTLSGGQQQRVALARAIINRPRVLLLDEPLAALDLKLRKKMRIELKRLHERLGLTFVYVTHDQEEALAMSDRIAVMNHGEIAQLGTGEEIYRHPSSRYVADFIGEANLIGCTCDAHGTLRVADTELPYKSIAGELTTTLMVRPEDISIGGSERLADDVVLPIKVKDKLFVGQGWRIFAVLETQQEIAVQSGANAEVERLRAGDMTVARWARDRGQLLSR